MTHIQTKDEIPKEVNITPENWPLIIDKTRLIWYINRMRYQNIVNLIDNKMTEPSKFET